MRYPIGLVIIFLLSCQQHETVNAQEEVIEALSRAENQKKISLDPGTHNTKDFTFSTAQSYSPLADKGNNAVYNPDTQDIQYLQPRTQVIAYNPASDTVLYGAAGSIIAIAGHSLETKSGVEASGTVTVQLTEYVKPSQFAAENLITRTTDGIILETVGMLNIIALQQNDTLQLKDKHPISVAFPLKNTRKDFKVWDAVRNQQGMAEWEIQDQNDTLNALKNRKINVQMVLHAGDTKNQPARLRTCSGAGWQNYFNRRFVFPENIGEELNDNKNFLAYAFKVNKSGRVVNVFVEDNLYSKEVYNLSKKYENYVENFLKKYPKLNVCKMPDAHKRTFRFKVMSGAAQNPMELVYISPEEGGYTAEELAEMYSETGEAVYLDAWMNRTGSQSQAVPQTQEKLSTALMNKALGVIGNTGRVVLKVASLGLINGDACANLRVKSQFKTAAFFKVLIQGSGSAVYLVFKNVRSFLKGSAENGGLITFGDRLPPGQEVYLVALSEIHGQKYMSKVEYVTDSQTIAIEPNTPFNLQTFQQWIDNEPAAKKDKNPKAN
jgi:hypothetical protein